MTLKGTTKDSPTLARELGVSHLVTGSVRRAGDALRVTAELVEARTDRPIWSEKYSGTMEDVFGIQEEIARKIVAALKVTLTESEEHKVAERPVENVVAYDCYLRARQEMFSWTPDGMRRASKLVDEALAVVGDNALLLATKGQIFWTEVNAMMVPAEIGLARATEFADLALAIDPDCALGVYVRGLIAGLRGEVEAALRDLHRARELDPSENNVAVEFCRFSNAAGLRSQEGEAVKHLSRVDPLNHFTWFVASTFHSVRHQVEEAATAARRAMDLAPAVSPLHVLAAWQLAEGGHRDEALAILDRAATTLGDGPAASWAEFLAAALRGDTDRAQAAVTPELQSVHIDHWAHTMASGYALLGLRDEAMHWVRICIDSGFINYPCLNEHDPFLTDLRADPEFQQLMADLEPRWEAVVAWERSEMGE